MVRTKPTVVRKADGEEGVDHWPKASEPSGENGSEERPNIVRRRDVINGSQCVGGEENRQIERRGHLERRKLARRMNGGVGAGNKNIERTSKERPFVNVEGHIDDARRDDQIGQAQVDILHDVGIVLFPERSVRETHPKNNKRASTLDMRWPESSRPR